jgi:integrase
VRLFLAEAKRSSRHYALYLTAILTGMRRGELLGLRWRDVDLATRTLWVRQALQRRARLPLSFIEPKTKAGRRTIDLDPMLCEALRQAQATQRGSSARCLASPSPPPDDLVFATVKGRPLQATVC